MRSLARKARQNNRLRARSYLTYVLPFMPFALLAVAAIILLLSSLNPNLWSGPRKGVVDLFTPVLSAFAEPFRYISDSMDGMSSISQLRAENEQLKSENERLKQWYQTGLLLQAENKSLRDLLNVIPEPEQRYVSTRVIADTGSSFVKTLLIKAGQRDGIVEGQAVMASRGMIGRVIEVSDKASRVLLLNDVNSHIPVMVEGVNRKAILAGTNGDLLLLNHLPKDSLIEVGARIITSGHGGLFPQGLPVGQVVKLDGDQIFVRAYSDPQNASMVQVIDKPDDATVRRSIDVLTKTISAGDGDTKVEEPNEPSSEATPEASIPETKIINPDISQIPQDAPDTSSNVSPESINTGDVPQ